MAIALVVVASAFTLGYEARASYRSNAFCRNAGQYGDPSYKKPVLQRRMAVIAVGVTEYTFTHEGAFPGSRYLCAVDVTGDKVVGTRVSHEWTF